jgi:hypothetical protein
VKVTEIDLALVPRSSSVTFTFDLTSPYLFSNCTTPPQICFGFVPLVSGKRAKRRISSGRRFRVAAV